MAWVIVKQNSLQQTSRGPDISGGGATIPDLYHTATLQPRS